MKKLLFILGLGFLSSNSFAQIVANNDFSSPQNATTANGNTVVQNVLSNDLLNGLTPTLSNVTLIQLATTNPNFNLNTSTGAVILNPGTETPTYVITYQICETINPNNCATATIALIYAADDPNVVLETSVCGPNVYDANLLFGNDSLNGNPIILDHYVGNTFVPGNVNVTFLNASFNCFINYNGQISIQGTYNEYLFQQMTYQICDKLNPSICDTGTFYAVNGNVMPFAQNDDFSTQPISNITGGTTLGSVLYNDYSSCWQPVSGPYFSCINVDFPNDITLNADGTITVAIGTTPGTYLLHYGLYDGLFGGSSEGQILLVVTSDSTLIANYDNFNPICTGNIYSNVLTNDTFNTIPINIPDYTVTAINPPNGITISTDGFVNIAPNVSEGIYNLRYQVCRNADPTDCNVSFAYLAVVKNKISGKILYSPSGYCGPNSSAVNLNNIKVKNVVGSQTYFTQSYIYNPNYPNYPNYYILGDIGTNTLTLPDIPSYFNVNPNPKIVNLTTTCEYGNYEDFCISPNSNVNDLEVELFPTFPSRPGFVSDYVAVFKNNGSTSLSGSVTIVFDNTKMSFISSAQSPNTISPNSLTFNFSNLTPFQQRTISSIRFQILTNPIVNSGDDLTFTTSITPTANDATPINNTTVLSQTVVNSFDPNDIAVREGETIYENQTDDYLHYTIRFQNTGTASAINVRIVDELDSKLDWNTMQILSSSHNCRLKQKNNSAEFLFEGINLPDNTTSEYASHGYITYKIKPIATIAVGDVIPNTANIYFDYNAPITTNTVTTTVIANLGNENFAFSNLNYFPNPVKNSLSISNTSIIDSVEITSILGQQMLSQKVKSLQTEINLSEFSNGIYFVKVTSQGQEKTIKIVKE
jgi:uncharacterized repeat protein (TIGR01451 family)